MLNESILDHRHRIVRLPFKGMCYAHAVLAFGQIAAAANSVPNYLAILPTTAVSAVVVVSLAFLAPSRALLRSGALAVAIGIHGANAILFLPSFYQLSGAAAVFLICLQLDILLIAATAMLHAHPLEFFPSAGGIVIVYLLYQKTAFLPGWFWIAAVAAAALFLVLLNQFLTTRSQQLFAEQSLDETRKLNARLSVATAQVMGHRQREHLAVLSAGLAHEINNPINYLQGNLYFLRSHLKSAFEKDDTEVSEILDSFETGIQSISQVTERLRELYLRADSPPRRVIVNEVVESCLTAASFPIGTRVTVSIPEDLAVFAHPADLYSVISNVLWNARDAIGEAGEVGISAEDRPMNVAISVRDSGCGILRDILGRVFDPFFTTKPEKDGMGVGLSLSKALIAKMNGTIRIESIEGNFTRVTLEVPKERL